jgi:hypothetical protein
MGIQGLNPTIDACEAKAQAQPTEGIPRPIVEKKELR